MAKTASNKVPTMVTQVMGLKIQCPRGEAETVRGMVRGTVDGFLEATTMKTLLPHTPQFHKRMTLDQALQAIEARIVK